MKRLLTFLASAFLAAVPAVAQLIPVDPKYGKVSTLEMAMTTYQLDTAASALVLLERSDVEIVPSDVLELTRKVTFHERIKILTEEGKSQADYKIPYLRNERVTGIKVTTYNMENGNVVKSELEKKYLFREQVAENVYTVSFSAPDVRVGSVIEVAYEYNSERYWEIPEFILQRSIPVNDVEAAMTYPDFLSLNKMFRGYLKPVYEQSSDAKTLRNNVLPHCQIITDQYRLVNVPAIPKESFSMAPSNYRCAVCYELSGVTIPGALYRSYSLTWADVDKQVKESAIVSQCRVRGKFLDPFEASDPDEKVTIAKVREAVAAAVKWDGSRGLVPDNIRDVVKAGSGDAPSINAIVASVLNKMGYKAEPMLVRSRSEGPLTSFYVRTDAFTDMLLRIETPSGQVCYLDAGPDEGYVNLLDSDFLVEEARVIPLDPVAPGYWENLEKLASGNTIVMANMVLMPDGRLVGVLDVSAYGVTSFLLRDTRRQLETDEKYFELVEKGECFECLHGEYKAEPYANSTSFKMEVEQEMTRSGEFLYIKPFLITQHHQSDFPPGERNLPVDFPFKESVTYTYNLSFPEGYAVEQLPAPVSFRGSGFQARVACQTKLQEGNVLTTSFSYKNGALMVPAASYEDLRAFWEQLCKIYQETIVLKKL